MTTRFFSTQLTQQRYIDARGVAMSRLILYACLFGTIVLGTGGLLFAQSHTARIKARLAAAETKAKANDPDVRYWSNVLFLHQTVKQGEFAAARCGKVPPSPNPDAAAKDKTIEVLSDAALKAALPALAAFLEGPVGVAAVVFLKPTAIGKDAFQIIDNASTGDPTEVISASRRMLLDTNPDAMKQISAQRRAVIYKCGHQVSN